MMQPSPNTSKSTPVLNITTDDADSAPYMHSKFFMIFQITYLFFSNQLNLHLLQRVLHPRKEVKSTIPLHLMMKVMSLPYPPPKNQRIIFRLFQLQILHLFHLFNNLTLLILQMKVKSQTVSKRYQVLSTRMKTLIILIRLQIKLITLITKTVMRIVKMKVITQGKIIHQLLHLLLNHLLHLLPHKKPPNQTSQVKKT